MSDELRAPLFDRLVDRDPRSRREVRPLRTLSRAELKESVRRELARLLNTRCPLPADRLAERPTRTVLEYGIPDLSDFSAVDPGDRERLQAELERAIEAYEPRLHQPRVTLHPPSGDDRRLTASIEGTLVLESAAEPFAFPTVLSGGDLSDPVGTDAD